MSRQLSTSQGSNVVVGTLQVQGGTNRHQSVVIRITEVSSLIGTGA